MKMFFKHFGIVPKCLPAAARRKAHKNDFVTKYTSTRHDSETTSTFLGVCLLDNCN